MSPPPHDEYANRVARARHLMHERRIDGLVVTDPVHYTYFSGHKVPSWMKSRPSILVFALDDEPTLINWSGPGMFARLYRQPYPSWVQDRRIYPEVPFDREPRVDWGIAEVLSDKGLRQGRVGI